jgi:hypothetical protein
LEGTAEYTGLADMEGLIEVLDVWLGLIDLLGLIDGVNDGTSDGTPEGTNDG